jgi:ABC-type nitrate/sulfonate/bicarbonate transport system permease component
MARAVSAAGAANEPAATAAPPLQRALGACLRALAPALSIVAVGLAWEMLAVSGAVTPFQLPRLSVVLARIWTDAATGDLPISLAATLYRALAGFGIAAVAGVVLGVAMARSGFVRWLFDPIVSVGFPMPKVAFLPVIMLWLGVYDTSKIAMVILDTIFPVITATLVGIAGVDRHLLWSARSMGASERGLLWQVVLPAALPEIMTGLQVAFPIALIVTIVAEMLMGGYGLGGAMAHASHFADSPGVFAGIVEIAAIGYVLVKAMALVRRRLLIWHQEASAPSTV